MKIPSSKAEERASRKSKKSERVSEKPKVSEKEEPQPAKLVKAKPSGDGYIVRYCKETGLPLKKQGEPKE